MFIASDFKKSVFISLLGHLAFFSFFSFSFGRIYPSLSNFSLCFLGQTLRNSEISDTITPDLANQMKFPQVFSGKEIFPNNYRSDHELKPNYYLKPQSTLSLDETKLDFRQDLKSVSLPLKESVIMLRPLLPYYFMLFFNDRKSVHLELQFNIISDGPRNYTIIKRRITSGNLEVDLLSMRYISHYLFIQNNRFPRNSWQTIKIDLSAK